MGLRQWLSRTAQPEDGQAPASRKLEGEIIDILRSIYDPEIPVNIYDLGLIYQLEIEPDPVRVHIRMTLTAPACPVAATFPDKVVEAIRGMTGIEDVSVELVWEPPWSKAMMSEAARLELGLL